MLTWLVTSVGMCVCVLEEREREIKREIHVGLSLECEEQQTWLVLSLLPWRLLYLPEAAAG